MKAIVCNEPLPIADPRSLVDAELPDPASPAGHDLLVRVHAVSVNPVDTKMRAMRYVGAPAQQGPRILGFDSAGVVEKVGEAVTLFKPGDAVYYAGSNIRPGSNAELQLVDERIVGRKPTSLDFAAAAAMPLTTITAYEAIVDRMGAKAGQNLLVIGGAGGVGSMAIQIGKQLGLRVIATASRPESAAWCRELGADETVDHRQPLAGSVKSVDCILQCVDTNAYWAQMADVLAPQGAICSIVSATAPVDLQALMRKSARFSWEGMFARSMFGTPDMVEQHRLLCRVADWVDAGEVKSTLTATLGPINATNLREAHARVESKAMIGKVVVAGW
jgi:zinc-binding alcohol dehydrogenase family protein